jgi:hypothetical protein
MSNTYDQWIGLGPGGTIVAGDPHTPALGEQWRQNSNVLAYLIGHVHLGGDERPIITDTEPADGVVDWRPVNGAIQLPLDGDQCGGLTTDVLLHYYTTDAATSVQMRLYNLSDSSVAATGSISTSTTVVTQTVSVTLASGTKIYQLQIIGGNVDHGVYGWGMFRGRKVPA